MQKINTFMAGLAVAATTLTLTGCKTGDQSGQVPFGVINTDAQTSIAGALEQFGPGVAFVSSEANTALGGIIADGISSNSERNNRFIGVLYRNADGSWRKDIVHAVTGYHVQGSPLVDYQPTEREVLVYVLQQRGAETKLMHDGAGGLLQGFKDVDVLFVRNRNVPGMPPLIVEFTPFDGTVQSVRLATDEEMLIAQTRPNYGRLPGPQNITRIENYDPWGHVYREKDLQRSNMNAGSPNPTPAPHRNRRDLQR